MIVSHVTLEFVLLQLDKKAELNCFYHTEKKWNRKPVGWVAGCKTVIPTASHTISINPSNLGGCRHCCCTRVSTIFGARAYFDARLLRQSRRKTCHNRVQTCLMLLEWMMARARATGRGIQWGRSNAMVAHVTHAVNRRASSGLAKRRQRDRIALRRLSLEPTVEQQMFESIAFLVVLWAWGLAWG